MANDKNPFYEGLGYFFLFAGVALCLFALGWCSADFPGLQPCEEVYEAAK